MSLCINAGRFENAMLTGVGFGGVPGKLPAGGQTRKALIARGRRMSPKMQRNSDKILASDYRP